PFDQPSSTSVRSFEQRTRCAWQTNDAAATLTRQLDRDNRRQSVTEFCSVRARIRVETRCPPLWLHADGAAAARLATTSRAPRVGRLTPDLRRDRSGQRPGPTRSADGTRSTRRATPGRARLRG